MGEPQTPQETTANESVVFARTPPCSARSLVTPKYHVLYSSGGSQGLSGLRIAVLSLSRKSGKVLDLPGTYPLGFVDGQVVYGNTTNTVLAAPVDLDAGKVTGPGVPIETGVIVGATGGAKAALSPVGTFVFLGGARESQMLSADMRGATQPLLPDPRAYLYPRFSPDGRRLAVTIASGTRSDVWLFDFASRTPQRLTTIGSNNERAEWSPDGKRVLFRTDQGKQSAIWWQPSDLSGPATPLLTHDRAPYFEAVMTPDGRGIVYQVDSAGADVAWRSIVGDTTPKTIAGSRYVEQMARISPDGHWVAYVTDESGTNQVVVQPFPGPGGRIQVSTGGGTEPVWSRDSRQLYYRGSGKFIAATVTAMPTFTVTSRAELFVDEFMPAASPHANYDVSPDGAHFVVLRGAEDPRLIVVEHWAEALRQRTAKRP